MSNTTDAESLGAEIQAILRNYGTSMQMAVDDAAKALAKQAARELRQTSPKGHSGNYAKGWDVKREKTGNYVVYNKEYRLTHLLEHGHRTRLKHGKYGTKAQAAAKTHIAPIEREVQQAFPGMINHYLKIQK